MLVTWTDDREIEVWTESGTVRSTTFRSNGDKHKTTVAMSRRAHTAELETVLATVGGLIAGFAVGWFFSSPRGRKASLHMTAEASKANRLLDQQLKQARESVLTAGEDAAAQLRGAVSETVQKVILELGTEAEWQDIFANTATDIQRTGK